MLNPCIKIQNVKTIWIDSAASNVSCRPHTFYYMELALEGKLTRKLNMFKVGTYCSTFKQGARRY